MAIAHLPVNPAEPPAYGTLTMSENGRVTSSAPLLARDYAEALSLAAAMVRDAGIDLWDSLRFIAHFESTPAPQPLSV